MTTAASTVLAPRTQWTTGRVTIALIAIAWLILCSPIPGSLNGAGMIIALALIALDVVLGTSTRWLAFSAGSRLDERQMTVRDDAYRTAFHWMRALLILMLILALFGAAITSVQGSNSPAGVTLRFLIALGQLVLILPTAVLAWGTETFAPSQETPSALVRRWWPLAVVPIVIAAWVLGSAALPARLISQRSTNISFSMAGTTGCDQRIVEKEVAAGLGGAVGFHAEICWNGRQAFVVGDPSLGLPPGLLPEQEVMPNGPALPGVTLCSPGNAETDFAVVSQTCQEHIDADGTMTLTAHGRVSPIPGGLDGRDLQVELVVDRDGKVLSTR